MNSGGGHYFSGQQNQNKERNRYGKQGGGNYQNQGNGQQIHDQIDQQSQERIEAPAVIQDQQQ